MSAIHERYQNREISRFIVKAPAFVNRFLKRGNTLPSFLCRFGSIILGNSTKQNEIHLSVTDRGTAALDQSERKKSRALGEIQEIPVMYTDSDEETDEIKKKITFLELEEILRGLSPLFATDSTI